MQHAGVHDTFAINFLEIQYIDIAFGNLTVSKLVENPHFFPCCHHT